MIGRCATGAQTESTGVRTHSHLYLSLVAPCDHTPKSKPLHLYSKGGVCMYKGLPLTFSYVYYNVLDKKQKRL